MTVAAGATAAAAAAELAAAARHAAEAAAAAAALKQAKPQPEAGLLLSLSAAAKPADGCNSCVSSSHPHSSPSIPL